MSSQSGLQAKNILIFGATGAIGSHIIDALVDARADYERLAIFTSPATVKNKSDLIAQLKSKGVEIIVGDLKSEEQVRKAYEGIDTVISAVGRNTIADQTDLIKWADETQNVKWFFPSEYGTDIEYGPASMNEKPHQQKLRVRAFLKTVKNLSYTYVVTGPFADMYLYPKQASAPESGSFTVETKTANLLGDGTNKISLTTMSDVGKLVFAALRHPDASQNKALKVNSFTTTPNGILAEYERQTGEKWTVTYTPLDKLVTLESQAWKDGKPYATVLTLRRIWTEGGTLYEKRDNESIGASNMQTLADAVAASIKEQTNA